MESLAAAGWRGQGELSVTTTKDGSKQSGVSFCFQCSVESAHKGQQRIEHRQREQGLSTRSSIPPWPGSRTAAVFTPAPRLMADSARSPTCPATFAASASAPAARATCRESPAAGKSARRQHRSPPKRPRLPNVLPGLIARRQFVASEIPSRRNTRRYRRSSSPSGRTSASGARRGRRTQRALALSCSRIAVFHAPKI